jgi:TRAP-type mannitol/chloroaromatic compound transport system substrate-binding protein
LVPRVTQFLTVQNIPYEIKQQRQILTFGPAIETAKPIVLRDYQEAVVEAALRIKEKSGGKVSIQLFGGGTLNPPPEAYDAAVKGIADLVWGPHSYMPGRFPLMSLFFC